MVQSREEDGNTIMFRYSDVGGKWGRFISVPLWTTALALVLVSCLVALAAKLRQEGILVVEESVENFRDGPNGKKVGTLLQGTEIEKISQEGKWVRFRVEGWVWGPSLDGFELEKEEREEEREEEPRLPLRDELPRIKRFVEKKEGVFYGIDLDEELKRLTVRFRVRNIEQEVLERRQMAVQLGVLKILEGEVEFDSIRIETNRPDGSGRVGSEIAESAVGDIKAYADGPVDAWKERARISSDGGETWSQ